MTVAPSRPSQAYIRDPQGRGPALLTAHGLTPRGKPKFKEPAVSSPKPARCPGGTPRNAATIQLSEPSFSTSESSVTRSSSSPAPAVRVAAPASRVSTRGGTARAGPTSTQTSTTVRFGNGDATPRLAQIPMREDKTTEPPEKFTVSISHPRCAKLGARRSASVTILDDDQPPPPPPPPAFTIGGTVDGLQGSGLVLSNLGAELPVSGNGSFTFPGTASRRPALRGQRQDPAAHPRSGVHGRPRRRSRGRREREQHRGALQHARDPSGLDATFGSGGRVSTPVGGIGDGEAVVIQPNGGIVTVGSRGSEPALTSCSPATDRGILDASFGTNGVAVTDLGGKDDKALRRGAAPRRREPSPSAWPTPRGS